MKRQQQQQQQQPQQQHKAGGSYPVGRQHQQAASVRQPEFDREQIQLMAAAAVAAMHAVKAQEAAAISISSPPSDAPTPLPPPMPAMVSSSSPCARSSPYDRQTPYRPSSREGMLDNKVKFSFLLTWPNFSQVLLSKLTLKYLNVRHQKCLFYQSLVRP